jgi:hypothetical protein
VLYDKMAAVTDINATLEHRVRSYLSSNCSHCHQPNNIGPVFDARYDTPVLSQNIFAPANSGYGALIRKNLNLSRLYVRDSIFVINPLQPPIPGPMPPIARNIPDPALLALYAELVNYPYEITSVTANSRTQVRVKFSSALDPSTANNAANYAINNTARIVTAALDNIDPTVVILTTDPLPLAANFTLTVNRVKEAISPQNPIWPNSVVTFGAPTPTAPGAPAIVGTQAGNGRVTLSITAPADNGGALISIYTATCVGPTTVTATSSTLSIIVTGLSNATTYACTVTATNTSNLTGSASANANVTPIAPVLLSVTSTKTHGNAGPFALPIATVADINANVTVEPRNIDGGHSIVFRFDIPVTSPGDVSLVLTLPASGATASATVGTNTNEIIVNLTGVSDKQRIAITLSNIDGVPSAGATTFIGFIAGDVNNSRSVTPGDVSSVKARAGQTTNSRNFWFDLNASGGINAADVSAVKARVTL